MSVYRHLLASLSRVALPMLAVLALLVMSALSGLDARAQTRRALLVGIDTYTANAQRETVLAARDVAPERGERGSGRGWTDLDGAVNDARALASLLTTRFGFEADNVRLLLNTDATRDGILQALRDLRAVTGPGDAVVFFYAGHGSQVVNEATREADRLDESIVPADARLGVPDIRDKELRVLFNELLATGAEVTVLFDSCHSGSVTRGVTPGKSRSVKPGLQSVRDDGPLPPPPQEHPAALVLSAAQDHEPARELRDGDGTPHGAFSWALATVLRTAAPATPARDVFVRVRALMQGHGFTQEPVLAGSSARQSRPLFGGATRGGTRSGTRIPVIEARAGTVVLQGGAALGLRLGCELCVLPDTPGAAPDSSRCVEVTRVEGVTRAEARMTRGDADALRPGDVMVVTRWVASPTAPLRLWIPPALDAADTEAAAETIAAAAEETGASLVDDPTVTPAIAVVQWTGTAWRLADHDGTITDLGGPQPDTDALRAALQSMSRPRLFVQLPPTPGLTDAVRTALGGEVGVEIVTEGRGAHYVLSGGVGPRGLAVRWIYAPATESGAAPALPPRTRPVPVANPTLATDVLTEFARRLNRVWGWMHLESPPDDGRFPYRLTGFEDVETGALTAIDDTLTWGHRYRIVIAADPAALDNAERKAYVATNARRYLYLFAIDRSGNGTLLYPTHGENVENDIDLLDDVPDPTRFTIPTSGYLFESYDAAGDRRPEVDTFFLLTTAEPITDPQSVFTFDGVPVRSRGVADSPLARLFLSTGHGTRSTRTAVPTDWSITRASMISTE